MFLRRRERAKGEFRRRNIFELYIEEVVEACNRLKGGKLPKEKLKEQLQKIALKRTGGEKTDEILGYDGGGPEGLPHSIIVTAEGTEGEAPSLPDDQRNDGAPSDELPLDVDESPAPARSKGKAKATKSSKTAKSEKTGKKNPAKIDAQSAKQMTLGFDKAEASAKREKKTGKKHGAKKAKK